MKPCGARCDYKEWYWIIYESNFFILIDWVRVFVANTEYWRAQWSCDTLKPTAGWPQGPNHRTSLATLSAAGMGLTMTMSGSPSLSTWYQVRWIIRIDWEEFHVIFDWDIYKYKNIEIQKTMAASRWRDQGVSHRWCRCTRSIKRLRLVGTSVVSNHQHDFFSLMRCRDCKFIQDFVESFAI